MQEFDSRYIDGMIDGSGDYQLDVDVNSVTFTHHHLFSREHVLSTRLSQLYAQYTVRHNKNMTQFMADKVTIVDIMTGFTLVVIDSWVNVQLYHMLCVTCMCVYTVQILSLHLETTVVTLTTSIFISLKQEMFDIMPLLHLISSLRVEGFEVICQAGILF